ncbi:MAG: DUF3662 and FHA domain-containing protein [Actinomycetota bacterium]|nr:DUF3662 and FHA domain-containing protein [Actinomycetota bacterium]MDH4352603.1 DUF3662 and FHA domain-containing protein [Actinomycetota bacterium]MDH5278567.1 DUF3662 and FHA domain-containing protein [Actinomycetota bacterium]
MGVLDRFERRLDRLVSGAFARAFKAEVQPVEIASALQRECDDKAAIVGRGRTMVPNEFHVELGPSDFQRLATYLAPLSTELADVVREHAGEQGYALVGPVAVTLQESDALETGVFRVVSEAVPGEMPPTPLLPNVRLETGGRVLPLKSDQVVIGRGTEADVRLDDVGVSRRHAIIRLSPTPTVRDLGSTNGTVVDGIRVDEADLVDGTSLVVGSTTLVFRYGG